MSYQDRPGSEESDSEASFHSAASQRTSSSIDETPTVIIHRPDSSEILQDPPGPSKIQDPESCSWSFLSFHHFSLCDLLKNKNQIFWTAAGLLTLVMFLIDALIDGFIHFNKPESVFISLIIYVWMFYLKALTNSMFRFWKHSSEFSLIKNWFCPGSQQYVCFSKDLDSVVLWFSHRLVSLQLGS